MDERIEQTRIDTFLDTLASKAPTPGGGSVAALSGAMAAGLVSMVCALMIGKKQYAEIEDEMRGIHDRAESLRRELQALAQDDIAVFGRLSAAYKLPRTTDADAASRQAAIQTVTRHAAEVPLRTAWAAAALLPLCAALVERCGRLVVSDIGVAASLVNATVESALLNVEINLSGLDDTIYVRQTRGTISDMTAGLAEEAGRIVRATKERIN